MLIVIDLGGSDEVVIDDGAADKVETQRLEEERQREAWLRYVQRNEAVLPQVVPVSDR